MTGTAATASAHNEVIHRVIKVKRDAAIEGDVVGQVGHGTAKHQRGAIGRSQGTRTHGCVAVNAQSTTVERGVSCVAVIA